MLNSSDCNGHSKSLPADWGQLEKNKTLAPIAWLKVGGPAELFFRPQSQDQLIKFLKNIQPKSMTVIGNSSNLLIRDGGVPGVVIRLGSGFSRIQIDGQKIVAGAGAASITISRKAQLKGLSGFEFMSGIPGTAGGGLWMNAGAFGRETKDVFIRAEALDTHGITHELCRNDVSFGYRKTNIDPSLVITKVEYRGEIGHAEEIKNEMNIIQKVRKSTQPINTFTGGSTFKNPVGLEAWKLIDISGCRGISLGGAKISDLHCNFMVNTGKATAHDFEKLGKKVVERVLLKTGIKLEWEIQRIGVESTLGGKRVWT